MKKNILIIDDSKFKISKIKDALQKIYKEPNFRVQNNFNAAMRFINDNQEYIDFIVLDWMFPRYPGGPVNPEMGEEIVQEIFERDMNIPIIICSSDKIGLDEENIMGEVVFDESADLKDKFTEVIGQENIDRDNEENVVKKI